MTSKALSLFAELLKTNPEISFEKPTRIEFASKQTQSQTFELYLYSSSDKSKVSNVAPLEDPEATIQLKWEELEQLIDGELTAFDLSLSINPLSVGMKTWRLLAQALSKLSSNDLLHPYSNNLIQIEQNFSIESFSGDNPKTLPIIINNFNRLSCFRRLIDSLLKRGYHNLYVIDNASDYPDLLAFYREAKLRVFRLSKNVGAYALWRLPIEKLFLARPYAYTDPDVLPVNECPDSFAQFFLDTLSDRPNIQKIGFGLKIDDLPSCYADREAVVKHEAKFWSQQLDRDIFSAPIDTTFAVYRAGARGAYWLPSVRTAGKYLARHLPWYINSNEKTSEQKQYEDSAARATHWTLRSKLWENLKTDPTQFQSNASECGNRYLIVNADDYGLTPGVSAGIREAHRYGIVTSTTALMNMQGIEQELRVARVECPNLDLGVHLNLSEGMPISEPSLVTTLVDENGCLRFSREFDPEEAEIELRAQVNRFIEYLGKPSHLDCHHHVALVHPLLFQLTVKLARELEVPLRWFTMAFLRATVYPEAAAFHDQAMDLVRQSGVHFPEHLELRFQGDAVQRDLFFEIINGLKKGVTELMCHPGRNNPPLPVWGSARESELRILTEPGIRDYLEGNGIRLVGYWFLSEHQLE